MRKHPSVKSTMHAPQLHSQCVGAVSNSIPLAVGPSRLKCLAVLEYPWVVLPVHPDVCAVDDDIPRPVLQARPIRAHHAYTPGLTSAAVSRSIGA